MSHQDIPLTEGSVSMSSSVFVVFTLGLLSVGTSVVIDGFFFYNFSIFSFMFSLAVTEPSHAFTFTDIAVVTTSEIDLFNDTGKLTGKLLEQSAELQSLEFDPVNKVLFVSDDTNSNVSIYTLNLQDGALEPFIQSENYIIFCIFVSTKFVVLHKNMYTESISFKLQSTNGQTRKCLSPFFSLSSTVSLIAFLFIYYHTFSSSIFGHTHTYVM